MSRIQLTMQEIKKGKVMDQLLRKELVSEEAAQILSITQRQVSRLLQRYKEAGIAGLAHKGRGRRSNRRIAEGQRSKIADLIKEHYWDYGPTLASETLQERDNIKLCKETTRQIMLEYNIWKSHTKNRKRKSWRKPRSIFGQMAQLDGSWHNWFEGRAPWAMLIKFVDDATSKILFAMFAPSESYASVVQATIAYFKQYGMPNELYTDKGSVLKCIKLMRTMI